MFLQFCFVIFWQKNISTKSARKNVGEIDHMVPNLCRIFIIH